MPSEAVGHYQPDIVSAEFPYWAKMATWTVAEAAAVLVGANPHIAAKDGGSLAREWKRYVNEFHGMLRLARKALDQNEVDYPETPANWVDWAKKRDLPLYPALEKEIDRWRRFKPPPDTADQRARIAQLEAKNAELEVALAKTKSAAEKSLATRERESMLKIIIGMAIGGFKYDRHAKRNDSVQQIVRHLERVGVSLSDDTVRKYLTEGSDLVPPPDSG